MGVDRGQVSSWLREATGELTKLSSQIDSLVDARSRLERRIALLRELLGEENAAAGPTVAAPVLSSPTSDFREALGSVLAAAGKPLHLTEIRAALSVRGVDVPGRGTDANIIAYLSRLPGVVRVDRGTYQLGGESMPVKAKVRRRKRRRSIAAKAK